MVVRLSRRVLLSALIAALATPAFAHTRAGAPPTLDALVTRVLQTFGVPGIGLAIVKDGEVVVARGFGVKRLGDPAPVDADTRFAIASNTKAFTAMALALLVDEGTVAWDAPVTRYLPAFQLGDPYMTRELTVRDLLVHRSGLGLGAGDLLWWPTSTYDRREITRRLRFLPIATSFRSAYAYDNVLYLVAGELIETITGQSWEQFVEERIVRRVGMASTRVRLSALATDGRAAAPHAPVDGQVRPIGLFNSDNTNPAGGLGSTATDMARWMRVLLNDGKLPDGRPLVSSRSLREMMTLVTPIPFGDPPKELAARRMNFQGYGLGFNVHDHRGRKIVTHTGGWPGFVSKLTLVPEAGLGIAVLTNQESGEAFNALTWAIVDHYLQAADTDWVSAYAAVKARRDTSNAEAVQKALASRAAGSTPSLPLERYAGTYRDAWYGDITIAREGSGLVMRFTKTPSLTGTLEHWQHDTFIARWQDRELRADAYVTFALEPDGSIGSARMRAVSPDTDFSFDFHHLRLVPVAGTP